jgi:anti-sigma regulatory factor (Ser/Thr protein kinase)
MPVLAPALPTPRHRQSRPPLQRHAALPANPRSISEARALVRTAIRSWDIPVDAETAALLVSELVTNAVTHDRTAPAGTETGRTVTGRTATVNAWVAVEITGNRDQLRVEVHDASPARPVLHEAPSLDAEHGRGLLLVDLLSSAWGCFPTAVGKAVYFTLVR